MFCFFLKCYFSCFKNHSKDSHKERRRQTHRHILSLLLLHTKKERERESYNSHAQREINFKTKILHVTTFKWRKKLSTRQRSTSYIFTLYIKVSLLLHWSRICSTQNNLVFPFWHQNCFQTLFLFIYLLIIFYLPFSSIKFFRPDCPPNTGYILINTSVCRI